MISDKFRKFLNTSESRMSLREAKRICERAGYTVTGTVSESSKDFNKILKTLKENKGISLTFTGSILDLKSHHGWFHLGRGDSVYFSDTYLENEDGQKIDFGEFADKISYSFLIDCFE